MESKSVSYQKPFLGKSLPVNEKTDKLVEANSYIPQTRNRREMAMLEWVKKKCKAEKYWQERLDATRNIQCCRICGFTGSEIVVMRIMALSAVCTVHSNLDPAFFVMFYGNNQLWSVLIVFLRLENYFLELEALELRSHCTQRVHLFLSLEVFQWGEISYGEGSMTTRSECRIVREGNGALRSNKVPASYYSFLLLSVINWPFLRKIGALGCIAPEIISERGFICKEASLPCTSIKSRMTLCGEIMIHWVQYCNSLCALPFIQIVSHKCLGISAG